MSSVALLVQRHFINSTYIEPILIRNIHLRYSILQTLMIANIQFQILVMHQISICFNKWSYKNLPNIQFTINYQLHQFRCILEIRPMRFWIFHLQIACKNVPFEEMCDCHVLFLHCTLFYFIFKSEWTLILLQGFRRCIRGCNKREKNI